MTDSLQEARTRTTRRLYAVADEGAIVPMEHTALLCAGTDIDGPDLVAQIEQDATDMVEDLIRHAGGAPVVRGFLMRSFWLGYEAGRR